jgi:hypothetical protein
MHFSSGSEAMANFFLTEATAVVTLTLLLGVQQPPIFD